MAFDLTDPMMAEAVHEVEVESGGQEYRNGAWWGGQDRRGVFTRAAHAPARVAESLNQRVLAKYMTKRQAAEAQAEEEAARQAELIQAAQAEAEQQRQFADALTAGGEGGGGAGGGGGRGGWAWGRSQLSQVSVPRHVAGLFGSVMGAGAGVFGAGMGLALSPLGLTGAGMTQVGNAVVNLLVGGLQAVATLGSSVLSLAMGAVLAGAIGAAGVVVLSAVGDLFGRVAQAITTSLQGVAQVVRDVFREAGEYARQSMQMVYMGGYTLPSAMGAMATFGALGVGPAETAGLLGQWSMRPEFLAMRLAPLGGLRMGEGGEIDWAGTLRGMRGALRSYPGMMQYPLLSGVLGAQGAGMLMPLMMMGDRAFEGALANADLMAPQLERVRALREELMPLQAQIGLLATVLKVELASAALQPVLVLLQSLVDLVRDNREEISEFMRALPSRLADWLAAAADRARELSERWPEINRQLGATIDHLRTAWRWIERIGDFIRAHPTLSAFLGGAVLGIPGGPSRMLTMGMTAAGIQAGTSVGGGWGGVAGGALNFLGTAALLRGVPALGARMVAGTAAPEALAFPVGAAGPSLLSGGAAAGGVLAAALPWAAIVAAAALMVGTAAYYGTGYARARGEQRASERQFGEAEAGARELGYVTYEMALESFGPAIVKAYHDKTMTEAQERAVAERYMEMVAARRGEQERREGLTGALETIRDRMHEVAENTSPHRVREAMRRGQEEAQQREPVVVLVRPSSQFELELEQQEALRTWRGIQVAVG